MPLKTYPFDVAQLLNSPEAPAEYLLLALEEGDPVGVSDALADIARARARLRRDDGSATGPAIGTNDPAEASLTDLLAMTRALGLKLAARAA